MIIAPVRRPRCQRPRPPQAKASSVTSAPAGSRGTAAARARAMRPTSRRSGRLPCASGSEWSLPPAPQAVAGERWIIAPATARVPPAARALPSAPGRARLSPRRSSPSVCARKRASSRKIRASDARGATSLRSQGLRAGPPSETVKSIAGRRAGPFTYREGAVPYPWLLRARELPRSQVIIVR